MTSMNGRTCACDSAVPCSIFSSNTIKHSAPGNALDEAETTCIKWKNDVILSGSIKIYSRTPCTPDEKPECLKTRGKHRFTFLRGDIPDLSKLKHMWALILWTIGWGVEVLHNMMLIFYAVSDSSWQCRRWNAKNFATGTSCSLSCSSIITCSGGWRFNHMQTYMLYHIQKPLLICAHELTYA